MHTRKSYICIVIIIVVPLLLILRMPPQVDARRHTEYQEQPCQSGFNSKGYHLNTFNGVTRADFASSLDVILAHEGGYVLDLDDRGGETYKGISRVHHKSWPGWQVIDDAKKNRASLFPGILDCDVVLNGHVNKFYKSEFWDRFMGDQIEDQAIANELFDIAVNQGIKTAVRYLQEALNALNRNQQDYPDIVPDGKFGMTTKKILDTYLKKNSPLLLLKVMNILQGMKYIGLMNANTTQEKYARSWLNRVKICTND